MPPAAEPAPELRFPVVRDRSGPRVVLVLGNEAPGGECPYYRAGRCHHCDIGRGEGARFDAASNRARLAWYRTHCAADLARAAHLVIYNSGSVLNPDELASPVLDDVVRLARGLPACALLSLDSREGFVDAERIAALARLLGAPRELRPIIGIESADDAIREGLIEKRMPRGAIERAVEDLGCAARATAAEAGAARIGLDVNIVVGGPGAGGDHAAADARGTARYALDLARAHGLPLGLNLHPYYPSARGLARFPDHPRPSLATVVAAAEAVVGEVRAHAVRADVFLGLHDEGHDRRPAERASTVLPLAAVLDRFHRDQDAGVLRTLLV